MKMPEAIKERIQKRRDREFLKAAMAASALTAYADGTVSYTERYRVEGIIDSLRWLLDEDADKAFETFESFVTALETDTETAEKILLGKLGRLTGDRDAAELVAYVALEVIHADDHFNHAERLQFQQICEILELKPADFV